MFGSWDRLDYSGDYKAACKKKLGAPFIIKKTPSGINRYGQFKNLWAILVHIGHSRVCNY